MASATKINTSFKEISEATPSGWSSSALAALGIAREGLRHGGIHHHAADTVLLYNAMRERWGWSPPV